MLIKKTSVIIEGTFACVHTANNIIPAGSVGCASEPQPYERRRAHDEAEVSRSGTQSQMWELTSLRNIPAKERRGA